MVKPQQFVVLAAATFVALILAAFLHASATQRAPTMLEGRPVLPELIRQADALSSIALTKRGRTLTLVRDGEQWTIKERDGYPAQGDKIRALLVQLTRAELTEPKTAMQDRWALLDLEDPTQSEAKSALVRLMTAGDRPLAELVVGKRRYNAFGAGRHGVYVRRPNEAQTWLANGDPNVTVEIKDWVDATIFTTQADKLKRLTISHPNESPIVLEGNGGKFSIKTVPEGSKLKEGAAVDSIGQALGSIELEDVRKLETLPTGDGVSTLTAERTDGVTVSFKLRRDKPEEAWLSFTATGEGDAKKSADEINAKAAGWEFKIPKWKADQIGKRTADLFEAS